MADLVKFVRGFNFRMVIPYLFYAISRFSTLVNFSWLLYHFLSNIQKNYMKTSFFDMKKGFIIFVSL